MTFDPQTTPPRAFYAHLVNAVTPRPIAWVSTVSPRGVANLAPYSFFNAMGSNPPVVAFGATADRDGGKKDSLLNVEQTREFVLNVVSFDLVRQMNCTSAAIDYEQSEFAACGVAELPSVKVKPPRVREAKVTMECAVHDVLRIGGGPGSSHIVVGRILLMHVDESVLDSQGQVDPAKLDTVGRMGGPQYCTTRDRFALERP